MIPDSPREDLHKQLVLAADQAHSVSNDRNEPALPRRRRVLVVEDESDLAEIVRYHLQRENLIVSVVESGEEALKSARDEPPDLIILDIMLPGMNGFEVCRRVKANPDLSKVPVIMLSARGEDADVVAGLECGADDYVTKPFSPRVLSARVKAVLRKRRNHSQVEESSMEFGDLVVYPSRHEVRVAGVPVDLTYTEFRILLLLARRPGWVYSREQIVDSARGDNAVVTPRSVDVHVVRLRSKLGVCGGLIETVRGLGYRLRETRE